ncbi:MAG TPA: cupredoxin domain-containing protein [bacterium]
MINTTRRTVGTTLVALVAAITLLAVAPAWGQDLVIRLTIKDHKFEPATIEAPAGQKFKLIVKNADTTAEEFESHDLKREKVIPGGSEITLNMGPLKPGTYTFFGEFNPKTAQGKLIVK